MIIFVRNLVVQDFWLKLFSLALGILIWVLVQGSLSKDEPILSALIGPAADESVMTVPVLVPRNVRVAPSTVEVTLRGDPKTLQELRMDDVRAEVDLTGIETADDLRRPIEMFLPPGVAYVHLEPDEVEVRLYPRKQ